MSNENCKDGFCEIVSNVNNAEDIQHHPLDRIIYVGDPMCSWCYGIAPVVSSLQAYCDDNNLPFDIVVGGLRSGGLDQWNESFRAFLRNEWQKIAQVTGQPFRFNILDLAYFDYDTTPSCKAIVTAKQLLPADNNRTLTHFYAAIQRRFYFDNEDPKQSDFYEGICAEFGIDYHQFKHFFESDEALQKTREEFAWCGQVGVHGFPTFLKINQGEITVLAAGYTSLSRLIRRVSLQ